MPDEFVDLVVTSPPYNVDKDYEAGVTRDAYYQLLTNLCHELKRTLKRDGRFCINIAQTMGSSKVIFSPLYILLQAVDVSGLRLRDIVIWNQSNSGNDTAWGSFASASCPWLRHQTENIVVGYNEQFAKIGKGESTISNRDFTVWTVDLWAMPTARYADHPAVFPEELPRRCIELFSYKGDLIYDPFAGTGTTLKMAKALGRSFIGSEIVKKYHRMACERVENYMPLFSENGVLEL